MASSDVDDQCAILEVTSKSKKVNSSSVNNLDGSNNSNSSSIVDDDVTLQSPSAESISTFHDMDKTIDLVLENNVDIVAKVDEPQKVVEPWGTYVTFRIRTKTTRWDAEVREYTVRRRYNDFKALRERLVEVSLQVVPPLPSRHTIIAQLDRYSRDFVLQRMALLNIFIKRLVSHSILTHNDDLKVFLTATPIEFSHHFKSKIGYLASISDSLYSLASPNGTPNLSSITCRVRDPEFSAVTDYMTSLYEKLSYFNSVSSRIIKERSDISAEMQVIRPILESWSQTERFNRDTLKINPQKTADINQQADDDFPLGSILKKMAKPFHVISAEQIKLTKEYPYIISNPIKEYLLYIQAVKEKLSRRDALQACLEGAQEKLTKKREKISNGGIPSQQMSPQLPKLAQEVEDCHDRLQCASEALRSDLYGWQRQKKTDLKMLLVEMARKHIEFHEKSLSSWEVVLPNQSTYKMMTDPNLLASFNHSNHSFSPLTNFSSHDSRNTSHISVNPSNETTDWENIE
ncbi:sorting nexin-30-like [Arctopsyche grandis]|uniref:sorting nexin-30-like n=1 Tax=Arctopsyche grandis TaxID=121162 RepID=UPI00406D69F7